MRPASKALPGVERGPYITKCILVFSQDIQSFRTLILGATALMAALAIGFSVGAIWTAPTSLPSLTGTPTRDLPATPRLYDDPHSLAVELFIAPDQPMVVAVGGRVTALGIAAGDVIKSGELLVEVNGAPLILLTTEIPLWRDLRLGDTGKDVQALQSELLRLGILGGLSGIVDEHTLDAVAALLDEEGRTETIDHKRFVWVKTTGRVETLSVAVGSFISSGESIGALAATVERGVFSVPVNSVSGERSLVVADATFQAPEDGLITDSKVLTALSDTASFRSARMAEPHSRTVRIDVTWVLQEPIEVFAIAPIGLYGEGDHRCVFIESLPIPVTLISSEFGQSLVTSAAPLVRVELPDAPEITCK